MRHDYYNTLLYKKALIDWHNLSQSDQIKHTLKGTKLFRDYQHALVSANEYIETSLDGASRRHDFIYETVSDEFEDIDELDF